MKIGRRSARKPIEIDEALDQVLERIDVERVDVVGRKVARPGGAASRSVGELALGSQREQPVDHRALQRRQVAAEAGRPPEIGQPLARFLRRRRAAGRRPASPR